MALLGLSSVLVAALLLARADLRADAEQQLLGWLLLRQEQAIDVMGDGDTLLAQDALAPSHLPRAQANVAQWLSRKYRVAPEPLSVLVAEAFDLGEKVRLDPTLILAVMAIESRFNPYAQSPVGAQGLMQVLTRVHTDKYEHFGGHMAAFDPVANLRVGVKVLKDCVRQGGSVESGLRCYVGAITTDGADYINKVMAEHLRIQSVALGKPMPTSFPVYLPEPQPLTPEAVEAVPQPTSTPGNPAPPPSLTLADTTASQS
ncbi:MAG: transglycosylase SLT domain-containing protein [Hydrogenophaga sp.]